MSTYDQREALYAAGAQHSVIEKVERRADCPHRESGACAECFGGVVAEFEKAQRRALAAEGSEEQGAQWLGEALRALNGLHKHRGICTAAAVQDCPACDEAERIIGAADDMGVL